MAASVVPSADVTAVVVLVEAVKRVVFFTALDRGASSAVPNALTGERIRAASWRIKAANARDCCRCPGTCSGAAIEGAVSQTWQRSRQGAAIQIKVGGRPGGGGAWGTGCNACGWPGAHGDRRLSSFCSVIEYQGPRRERSVRRHRRARAVIDWDHTHHRSKKRQRTLERCFTE